MAMPEETKRKISEAVKRACATPSVFKRRSEAIKRSMTPARRAAISRDRRDYWRRWREAKAARQQAQANEA